ncbi:hypothetical protein DAEQUDRAFT_146643 [Daedalea quercina L-15889]|uniref:Uncharacterized protein n=1 Tax=Daedalea quercina L-15889 TaxID=1314783 RepID=A0A165KNW3_9APHY|nr:hypothetical protein DAEQUDRAFT_146643 [Daedalea quercina L-15889]
MTGLSATALFRFANGGFTALRAYALSGHSMLLASIIFVLSSVDAPFIIFQASTFTVVNSPQPFGCTITMRMGVHTSRLSIIGQVCNIIAEALLVAVTWRHAYTDAINIADGMQIDTPLATTLLRDGTIYFAAIAVLQTINAALLITDTGLVLPSQLIDGSSWYSLKTPHEGVLTNITYFKQFYSRASISTCTMQTPLGQAAHPVHKLCSTSASRML